MTRGRGDGKRRPGSKRAKKPFVVSWWIEVNGYTCERTRHMWPIPISIRARQTSGRNVRVARVLCRKLHCWILNGAEKLGPPRTFSFLHNSRDCREEGTWVARKFAPDRNDVHLENRISRGAGWANRCIIVVWDCDRGFRPGLQHTVLCKYTGHRNLFYANFGIRDLGKGVRMIINYSANVCIKWNNWLTLWIFFVGYFWRIKLKNII